MARLKSEKHVYFDLVVKHTTLFYRRFTTVNLIRALSHFIFFKITPGARVTDGILLFATIYISMVFSYGIGAASEVDDTVDGLPVWGFSPVGCS